MASQDAISRDKILESFRASLPTAGIKPSKPNLSLRGQMQDALGLPKWTPGSGLPTPTQQLGRTTIGVPSYRYDWSRETAFRNNLNALEKAGLAFAEGPVMKVLETVTKPQSYLMATLKESLDWIGGGKFDTKELKEAGSSMYFFGDLLADYGILQGDSEWDKWGARFLGFTGDVILDPLNLTGLVGKAAGVASRLAVMGGRSIAQHALRNAIVRELGEEGFQRAAALGVVDTLADGPGQGINNILGAAVDDIVSGTSNKITRLDDGSVVLGLGKHSKKTGSVLNEAGEVARIDDLFAVTVDAATVRDIKVLMEAGATAMKRGATGVSNEQLRVAGRHIFESGLDISDRAARSLDATGAWTATKGYRKPLLNSIEQADNLQLAFGFKIPGTGPISKKIFKHKFQQPVGLRFLSSSLPGPGRLVRGIPQSTRKVMFGLKHGQSGLIGWMKRGGRKPELRKLMRTTWLDDPVKLHMGRRQLHAAGRGDAMKRSVNRILNIEAANFVDSMQGRGIDGADLAAAIGGDPDAVARIGLEATNEGREFFSKVADVVNEAAGYDFIKKTDEFYRPRRLSDAARKWMEDNASRLVNKKYREPYTQSGHEKLRQYVYGEQLSETIDIEWEKMLKKNPKATRAQAEKRIRAKQTDEFMGEPLLKPGTQMDNGSLAPDVEQQIAQIMERNGIPYALFDDDLYEMLPAYVEALSARSGEVYMETLMRNEGFYLDRVVELTNFPDAHVSAAVATAKKAQNNLLKAAKDLEDAIRVAEKAAGDEVAAARAQQARYEREEIVASAEKSYKQAKEQADRLIQQQADEEVALAEANTLLKQYEAELSILHADPDRAGIMVEGQAELDVLRQRLSLLGNIPYSLFNRASRAAYALVELEDRLLSIFGGKTEFEEYVAREAAAIVEVETGTVINLSDEDKVLHEQLGELFDYYDQTGMGAWMSVHVDQFVVDEPLPSPGAVADRLRNQLSEDAAQALSEYDRFVQLVPEMAVDEMGPPTAQQIIDARETLKVFSQDLYSRMSHAASGGAIRNMDFTEMTVDEIGALVKPIPLGSLWGMTDEQVEAAFTLYRASGGRMAQIPSSMADTERRVQAAAGAISAQIDDIKGWLDPLIDSIDAAKVSVIDTNGNVVETMGWYEYVDAKRWQDVAKIASQDVSTNPLPEPPVSLKQLVDDYGAENIEILGLGGSHHGGYSRSAEKGRIAALQAELGLPEGAFGAVGRTPDLPPGVRLPAGGSNPGVLIRAGKEFYYVKFYANRTTTGGAAAAPDVVPADPVPNTGTAQAKGYLPIRFAINDNGTMETQAVDWFTPDEAFARLDLDPTTEKQYLQVFEKYQDYHLSVDEFHGDSLTVDEFGTPAYDPDAKGAAAIIIDNSDPDNLRILLRMSADDPNTGEPWSGRPWSLAGGTRDPGEDVLDALRREISEEISAPGHWDLTPEDVEVLGHIGVSNEVKGDKEFFVVKLNRGGVVEGRNLVPGHKPGDGQFVQDRYTGVWLEPAASGRQRVLGEMLANSIYRIVGNRLKELGRSPGRTVSTGASLNRTGSGILSSFEDQWALTTEYATNLSSMRISGESMADVYRIALKEGYSGTLMYRAAEPLTATGSITTPESPDFAYWLTAKGERITPDQVTEVTESGELFGEQLMVEILVSNWDAFGANGDNAAIDMVTGELVRLDNGGGFYWSATGQAFKFERHANLDEVQELFPFGGFDSGAFFDADFNSGVLPARGPGARGETAYQRAISLWNAPDGRGSIAALHEQLTTILETAAKAGGWWNFASKVLPPETPAADIDLFARFLDVRSRKLAEYFQIDYRVNDQASVVFDDVWRTGGEDAATQLGVLAETYGKGMEFAEKHGLPAWVSRGSDDLISSQSVGGDPRSQALKLQAAIKVGLKQSLLDNDPQIPGHEAIPNNKLLFADTWEVGAAERMAVLEAARARQAERLAKAQEPADAMDRLVDAPRDWEEEISLLEALDADDPSSLPTETDSLENITDQLLARQISPEEAERLIAKLGELESAEPPAAPAAPEPTVPAALEPEPGPTLEEISASWFARTKEDAPFTAKQRVREGQNKIGVVIRQQTPEGHEAIRRVALGDDKWTDVVADVRDYSEIMDASPNSLLKTAEAAVLDATGLQVRVIGFLPTLDDKIPYFLTEVVPGTPTVTAAGVEIVDGRLAQMLRMRIAHKYRRTSSTGLPPALLPMTLGARGDWLDSLMGTNLTTWHAFSGMTGAASGAFGSQNKFMAYAMANMPHGADSIRVFGMPEEVASEYRTVLMGMGEFAEETARNKEIVDRLKKFTKKWHDPDTGIYKTTSNPDSMWRIQQGAGWFEPVRGTVYASDGFSGTTGRAKMASMDSTADIFASLYADDALRLQLESALREALAEPDFMKRLERLGKIFQPDEPTRYSKKYSDDVLGNASIAAAKAAANNKAFMDLAVLEILKHPRLMQVMAGKAGPRHDWRERAALLGHILQLAHFDNKAVSGTMAFSFLFERPMSVDEVAAALSVSKTLDNGALAHIEMPEGIFIPVRSAPAGSRSHHPQDFVIGGGNPYATFADGPNPNGEDYFISYADLFSRITSNDHRGHIGSRVIDEVIANRISTDLKRWLSDVSEADWQTILAHYRASTDPSLAGVAPAFVNELQALRTVGVVRTSDAMSGAATQIDPFWYQWLNKVKGASTEQAIVVSPDAQEDLAKRVLSRTTWPSHALLRWKRDLSAEGYTLGVWHNSESVTHVDPAPQQAKNPVTGEVLAEFKWGTGTGVMGASGGHPNMVILNPRALSSDVPHVFEHSAQIMGESQLLEPAALGRLGDTITGAPKMAEGGTGDEPTKLGYFFPTELFIRQLDERIQRAALGVADTGPQAVASAEAKVVAQQADVTARMASIANLKDDIGTFTDKDGILKLAKSDVDEAKAFRDDQMRLEVASKRMVANYRDALATLQRMTGVDYVNVDVDTLSDDIRNLLFAVNHLADADMRKLEIARNALLEGESAAEALQWLDPVGDETIFFPLAKWQDREEILETVWSSGFRNFGTYTQAPADLVEAMTTVTRFRAKGGWGAFLNQYDKIYNLLKGYMIMKPGFHMRNYFSGVFMNYLADVDLASYRQFQRAYWTYRHEQAVEKGWTARAAAMKKSMKLHQIWGKTKTEHVAYIREMDRAGILGGSHGQVAGEFDIDSPVIAGKKIDLRAAMNPFNPRNALLRISREAGIGTETFLRGVMGFDALKKGNTVDGAYDNIVKFHFDYDDLSDFERRVIKRIVPFYTWTKRALPLMLEQIGHNPAKMTAYLKAKRNIERDLEEPGIVPDYFRRQGGIQLPFKYKGESMFVLPDLPFKAPIELIDPALALKKDMPFEERMRSVLGSLGTQLSPLIKAPYEWQAKTNLWKGYSFQGRWQQVPTVYHKIPGLMHAMQVAGLSSKQNDIWIMRDYNLHTMTQLLPTLADMRRLFPSEERYQQRTLSTWMSFAFGLGLRTNTVDEQLRQQRSNWYRLQEKRSDERSRARAGTQTP